MTKNLSNISGDLCVNKWGVIKYFCTNIPELGKLIFLYIHSYMYLLWITNVNI